jgi:hypothetical protein
MSASGRAPDTIVIRRDAPMDGLPRQTMLFVAPGPPGETRLAQDAAGPAVNMGNME